MCDYWDDPVATNTQVMSSEQKMIVKIHNNYRSQVKPPASNMQKMVRAANCFFIYIFFLVKLLFP